MKKKKGGAEPSVCLFRRRIKERRDGGTDGRKRWPCLLSIRTIMSDDEAETGGGRGAEQRGEGQEIEVKEMEGWTPRGMTSLRFGGLG